MDRQATADTRLPTRSRRRRVARVLVVDNYDSFTHNVVDCVAQLGCAVDVVRNDATSVEAVLADPPAAIVLSPGPGRPEEAGISVPLVEALGGKVPILGICLGHQAIAIAYGGRVVRARRPLHGEASWISSLRRGALRRLPARFLGARYHSLVVHRRVLGRGLVATAHSAEGEVMALCHRTHPVQGVQFHPESHLTPHGPRLVATFLADAGLAVRPYRRVVR